MSIVVCEWQSTSEPGRVVCKHCEQAVDLPKNGKLSRRCAGSVNKHSNVLPSVSVVIPCHNYGRYLEEAIRSAKLQSHPPLEILVVDDSSSDNTKAVALTQRVKYSRVDEGSAFLSRRHGFQNTRGRLLCFLDADDRLPPDYLYNAAHMFQQDWKLGIVHSDLQTFGDYERLMPYPDHVQHEDFLRDNQIHAGSVVRRIALELTDAFEHLPPSTDCHEDYHLWKQVFAGGWHVRKQRAKYQYRKHSESLHASRSDAKVFHRHGMSAAKVTIAIPLAGRFEYWKLLSNWLAKQTWPKDQTSIILADTSQNPEFSKVVKQWVCETDLRDVRYQQFSVEEPGLADRPRHDVSLRVQDAVIKIWSRITKGLDTPFTLTLEDDTIPPLDLIAKLLAGFTPSVDAVVAPYLSRFGGHYVIFRGRQSVNRGEEGVGIEQVQGAGFGCMLVRSHLLKNHVWTYGPSSSDWYDPWFCRGHNLKMLCDWTIPVRHLPAEEL